MLFGRLQFLFVLILCLPQLLFGYCTKSKWTPPGWWGKLDYLIIWRKERFFPALVSTGTLGEPGASLLFGNSFEGNCAPRCGFRFDGGIWCCDSLAFGGSVIKTGNDPVNFSTNTDLFPTLARPYINALTDTPTSWPLNPFGSISISGKNYYCSAELYARIPLWEWTNGGIDGMIGPLYLNVVDKLEVRSIGNSFVTRFLDEFNCDNSFYGGMGGFIGSFFIKCVQINLWGKFAVGSMREDVDIFGDKSTLVSPILGGGLLTQPSNIGSHSAHQCEVISMGGADLNLEICGGIFLSVGYLGIYIPRVALAGDQVDLHIDLTQTIPRPEFRLRDTDFWYHGVSLGLSFYY